MSESMKHFKHEYQGIDASIEISLKEYGFAWHDTGTETHFIYGIKMDNSGEYIRFDRGWLKNDTDVKQEYNWIFNDQNKANSLLSYLGMNLEEWLVQPLPNKVYDIYCFYGFENTFGSPYWEGSTYEDAFLIDQSDVAKIHGS